jgi:hypothetical protein
VGWHLGRSVVYEQSSTQIVLRTDKYCGPPDTTRLASPGFATPLLSMYAHGKADVYAPCACACAFALHVFCVFRCHLAPVRRFRLRSRADSCCHVLRSNPLRVSLVSPPLGVHDGIMFHGRKGYGTSNACICCYSYMRRASDLAAATYRHTHSQFGLRNPVQHSSAQLPPPWPRSKILNPSLSRSSGSSSTRLV